MVPEFETEDDRLDAIRRLIAVMEDQIRTEFTHNEPMKRRLRQYKRWLREAETEATLNGYC